jgi:hypothetical protein
LISVLLRMDMNSYTLYTQKHTLLHYRTLDATDGSTTHQEAWMLPSFTHLLYCTTYSKFLNPPPMAQQPLVGQGPLITVASRSHSDTPHTCRTTLDEWSAQRRDPDVTTHNTHSMPPAGFKLTIPASEWRQDHALHCAATRTSKNF